MEDTWYHMTLESAWMAWHDQTLRCMLFQLSSPNDDIGAVDNAIDLT